MRSPGGGREFRGCPPTGSRTGRTAWPVGIREIAPRSSSPSSPDFLSDEPARPLVQHPARHRRRLALLDRDDHVAVEGPGVLAVVLAGAGGVVRVAVVEAEDDLPFPVRVPLGPELGAG